ncbi:970a79c8-8ada-48e2-a815-31a9a57f5dd7 [Sclerotinia trifoliorum]|uniref:970a79c8-8ada-48e2-a815-31a9a57f5dd7 n=1 Tax=Sclerotinia trifoliorum TaxID=28548 RepID=A0A8H2ZJY9_9HELO|nr:970a79c8-8ada-48e2-a815-31a9a57f5dd7 [Sclerotinia trifoliorum]
MPKRSSTQAAGSPAGMEKKANDVVMTNGKAGEAEKGESLSPPEASQNENETHVSIDAEKATGSNKRKRDFKAEREAKRQKKEAKLEPKRAAAAILEAEEAIAREKKAAEKAEAKRVREAEMNILKEQKMEEKAKKHEENLRQQAEDKQRRAEEKKRDIEAKKRDAEQKRKDRERIQALEKQVRDLKRGHGNANGKGKGAKKSWDKKPKGPKTSEFFGEGLKAQVIGLEDELKEEVADLGEEAEEESSKKVKSKRSWKDLKKGNVAPTGLEAKIAAARASVAQAGVTVDADVPMEDAVEQDDIVEHNEPEEEAEASASVPDVVSYPAIDHLIEDSPELAVESEAPAQSKDQGVEVPEEASEETAGEEQADSEIPVEDSKGQEEEVVSTDDASSTGQEDKTEQDGPKEDAAPAVDEEIELDKPKEEAEAEASAKKRSRKRVRNNNRLEAEETPAKPTTPASSKSQKTKTPTATPLTSKNQNIKTPSKSPAQTKATNAKNGKAPVKATIEAQTVSKSPKARRVRVPKARAAALASAPGLDSPARNTRRSAKANHS